MGERGWFSWFWDHWWTGQTGREPLLSARALGPVEEGTQGLQLSPGSAEQSQELRLSCAELRESVRSWDGAALTDWPPLLPAGPQLCLQTVQKVVRLCLGRMASVRLGVLAAPPTTPRRVGCGEEAACLLGGPGGSSVLAGTCVTWLGPL